MNQEVIAALKTLLSALGGVLLAAAVPVVPYAAVCTLMVLADAVTAWRLGRRAASATGVPLRHAGAW